MEIATHCAISTHSASNFSTAASARQRPQTMVSLRIWRRHRHHASQCRSSHASICLRAECPARIPINTTSPPDARLHATWNRPTRGWRTRWRRGQPDQYPERHHNQRSPDQRLRALLRRSPHARIPGRNGCRGAGQPKGQTQFQCGQAGIHMVRFGKNASADHIRNPLTGPPSISSYYHAPFHVPHLD